MASHLIQDKQTFHATVTATAIKKIQVWTILRC